MPLLDMTELFVVGGQTDAYAAAHAGAGDWRGRQGAGSAGQV